MNLAEYSTEELLSMRQQAIGETAVADEPATDLTAIPTKDLIKLRQQKQIESNFKINFDDLEKYGFGTKEQIQQQAIEAADELAGKAEQAQKSKGKIGLIENIKRKGDAPGRHGFDTTVVPTLEEAEIVRYAVIADKIKKDTANFEERQQLTGYLDFLQEEANRGKTIPAQIYDVVSQIPKFGIEFLLTGGAYTGVKKGTEKLIGKMVKNQIAKSTIGAMAGTAARTALMPHRVAGYAAKDQLFEGEESIAKSIAKGFGDTYIENLSEVSGEAIGKVGGKIAGKLLNLVPAESAIGKALRAIPEMELVKRISGGLKTLEKIGYHGTVEEILEERLGGVLRAATGLGKWEDVIPSGEQALVEAGAFAVPGVTNVAISALSPAKIETLKQQIDEGKETFSRKDVKELFGIDRSTAEERQQKFEEVKKAIETPAVEQEQAEPTVETPAEVETQPEAVKEPESIAEQIESLKAEGSRLVEESKTPEGIKNSEQIAGKLDEVDSQIQELENLKEKLVGNSPEYIAKKAGVKLHNKKNRAQSVYQLLGVEDFYLAGTKSDNSLITENSTELEKQAYNSGVADRPKTQIDATRQIPAKKLAENYVKNILENIPNVQQSQEIQKTDFAKIKPAKSKGTKIIPAREVATAGVDKSAPVLKKSKGLKKQVKSATIPSMAEKQAARDNIEPSKQQPSGKDGTVSKIYQNEIDILESQTTPEEQVLIQKYKEINTGREFEVSRTQLRNKMGWTKEDIDLLDKARSRYIKIKNIKQEQEIEQKALEIDTSPEAIQKWSDEWNKISLDKPKELSNYKDLLIRRLRQVAIANKWKWGYAQDDSVKQKGDNPPRYSTVIYFDSPEGQLSFHINYMDIPYEIKKLYPQYKGKWDGERGATTERLIQLSKKGYFNITPQNTAEAGKGEIKKPQSARIDNTQGIQSTSQKEAKISVTNPEENVTQLQSESQEKTYNEKLAELSDQNPQKALELYGKHVESTITEIKKSLEKRSDVKSITYKRGSGSSYYATVENLDGESLTIRLSDHTANAGSGIDISLKAEDSIKDNVETAIWNVEDNWGKSFNTPAPEDGGQSKSAQKQKSKGVKPKPVETPKAEKRIFDKAKADAYRKELFSGKQLFSGLDPEVLGKLVYIGGYHLENVGRSFAKWSKAMIDDLGERIKPHLDRIWAELSTKKAEGTKAAKIGDKKTDSVIARQLASDLKAQDIEVDLNYTEMNIAKTVEQATALAAKYPENAERIALGDENKTGINTNAIRLANFYQANGSKDWTKAERAAQRVISANIQAGQDIVVNKGFITDNSPMKFIKKLATAKMEQAGKKFGKGKEGSGVKKTTERIRQETAKVKEKMTLKQMKIQDAQDFIESLRCK